MYFKQKSNIIFRNYGKFGYVTDNRNFAYKQADDNKNDIGDKIVSQTGAVFLSVLDRKPHTLEYLAKKISIQFTDVDIKIIKDDAKEFYKLLELEGFVVSGTTLKECNEKEYNSIYKNIKNESSLFLNKNIKKSTQEFFDEYFNNEPQLTNIHIEITSMCNERCVHCYIPHEYKITNMENHLFYSILEQCKKMNVLHLTLSGGEPMLHNHFIDFLQKCNEYNFSVNILSNLTMLNKKIIEEMKKNPLLSVQVSLYSMDNHIHDAITKIKGSFEKTKNAILKLRENMIPVQISCPIMRQNVECYNDVVNWGKTNNINVASDYVIIARYNHSIENLSNRLTLDNVKRIIRQKIITDPQYIETIKKEAEQKRNINPDDFICSVCHSSICIAENGNVYPCAGWQDYVTGNINEKSLNTIWKDSTKINYLRKLRKKDFPKCMNCSVKEYCTMCMVRNANENSLGNPLIVNNYFCSVAKIIKRLV